MALSALRLKCVHPSPVHIVATSLGWSCRAWCGVARSQAPNGSFPLQSFPVTNNPCRPTPHHTRARPRCAALHYHAQCLVRCYFIHDDRLSHFPRSSSGSKIVRCTVRSVHTYDCKKLLHFRLTFPIGQPHIIVSAHRRHLLLQAEHRVNPGCYLFTRLRVQCPSASVDSST